MWFEVIRRGRQAGLDRLKANLLNERFGGSFFLFCTVLTSVVTAQSYLLESQGIFDFRSDYNEIIREDFVAFFRAGMLAQYGQAILAYDPAIFSEPFSEANKNLLFLNPPHAFLFFEALAYFSYPVARGIGLLINIAAIIGIVRIAHLKLGAWPYVLLLLTFGSLWSFALLQISPVIIFFILYALVYSEKRPLLSGIALAFATLKPQFGLLVPIFLFSQKDWRTLAITSGATLILIFMSMYRYGLPVWELFLESAIGGSHAGHLNQVYTGMITVSHSLGKLGFSEDIRTVAQACGIGICGAWIWYVAKTLRRDAAVPVVVVAMCAAAPSFFFYDWLMLCAGMLLFLKIMPAWPLHLQFTLGILWAAPLLQTYLIGTGEDVTRIELARYFSASLPLLMMVASVQMYFSVRESQPSSEIQNGHLSNS